MSTGIYKYQNKKNGKVYIGQSINIERRYNQHLYDATKRDPFLCSGIDIAMHYEGVENFTFEIIEECPVEKLDEREKYWIEYYHSYDSGYNRTRGGKVVRGEDHGMAILTYDQVWEIREAYRQHIKRSDVFKRFQFTGITFRGFLKVWNCETWDNVHTDVYTPENKEWHKKQVGHSEDQLGLSSLDRAIKQDEINLWLQDFKNGMTVNSIAKKYHRDNGTVEKYLHNPQEKTKIKYNGRVVKNLNTGKVFESISSAAKWANCGATTLTRHLTTDGIAGKVPNTLEPAEWQEI